VKALDTGSGAAKAIRRIADHLCVILGTLAALLSNHGFAAAPRIVLPIEVTGEAGTISSVTVDVPRGDEACSLWLQVHGLSFADMASVAVNGCEWLPIDNQSATVAEPGRSYGGIGGGFATLKLTIPLAAGSVADGENTIRFRFNRTDGIASGFRVLGFNFIARDGTRMLSSNLFEAEDPATWTPPWRDELNIAAGRKAWHEAALKANALPRAAPIRARCADCHAEDGRDLKYFNFSNASIVARSRFHGLSKLQGEQIASYIRSLPVPNPGRPWGPPYQPGPGLSGQPVANWAAGAGLAWVLDDDSQTLRFMFPTSAGGAIRIVPDVFRPDGDLDPRDVPISMQLPDWNHWLPRVHPLDAWENEFANSELSRLYNSGPTGPDMKMRLAEAAGSADAVVAIFERWTKSRKQLLDKYLPGHSSAWPAELTNKAYSTQLWQLVKTWEMMQELGAEAPGRRAEEAFAGRPMWLNAVPAATAPDAVGIPDGPSGMGGSAITNEYFNNAWYELQVLVSGPGPRRLTDAPYVVERVRKLYEVSQRPEPGRLLVAIVKALQSVDPALGPENTARGWRPDRNIDPRIMISPEWSPIFTPLSANEKRLITESMLSAWLDKNRQYPMSRYFTRGFSERSYTPTRGLAGVFGGKVWEAAPRFAAAGVSPALVRRLAAWGRAYVDMGSRFAY
jgi:hypothetical protein